MEANECYAGFTCRFVSVLHVYLLGRILGVGLCRQWRFSKGWQMEPHRRRNHLTSAHCCPLQPFKVGEDLEDFHTQAGNDHIDMKLYEVFHFKSY